MDIFVSVQTNETPVPAQGSLRATLSIGFCTEQGDHLYLAPVNALPGGTPQEIVEQYVYGFRGDRPPTIFYDGKQTHDVLFNKLRSVGIGGRQRAMQRADSNRTAV